MPVFRLTDQLVFPDPSYAVSGGLLAVGGDLSPERLLLAYANGIFPWYSDPDPILWWSPDPRLVLFPEELKVSSSLKRVIRKNTYKVTVNQAFREVIRGCADVRTKSGEGTWITREMIQAYVQLHELGFAHSIESWSEDELSGGLYGIALGRAFFGESMFSLRTDSSKVAFVHLVGMLRDLGFHLIDCQTTTEHLKRFGAREIPRREFLARLANALQEDLRPLNLS